MAGVNNMLDRLNLVLAEAEQAVRINPNLADAYVPLGVNYATMGRFDRSLAAPEKAHEPDRLAASIAELLARTSLVAGRTETAEAVLQRMDELTPRNARILNGLAEYYMVKQDFVKAQELLTKGLEVNPSEPLLRINQGVLFALTGKRKEAEEPMKEIMANKT